MRFSHSQVWADSIIMDTEAPEATILLLGDAEVGKSTFLS